MQNTFFLWKY